jgi:kumamolisin
VRPQSDFIPLPGSKKFNLPKGDVHNEPPPGEFTVRVMVRPQAAPPSMDDVCKARTADRKYLSREQHDKAYGANLDDLKKVEDFAARSGLKVVFSNPVQRVVLLSGAPAAFSDAFRVKLVTCTVDGHPYRCRTDVIHIPRELENIVTSVTGLDNRPFAKPHFRVTRRPPVPEPFAAAENAKAVGSSAAAPSSGGVAVAHAAAFPTGFTPPQIAALYNFPKQFDGTGQTIAILELGGGFRATELGTYFKQLGIKTPTVTAAQYQNGGSNNPGTNALDPANPDVEVMLDIEVAGSVSPGARIVVYFAPNASDESFLAVMTAVVHDSVNNPNIVSISWGGPEDSATEQFKTEFDRLLQSATQLGITVCAASGDSGSADFASNDSNWDGHAHVDFPASDPYVLGCGGTQVTASNGKITEEVTWNEGTNEGSGGGVSRFFPLPAYQQHAGVPKAASPVGPVMRGVPDVSGNAAEESGYRILCDGQQFPDASQGIPPVGGTSAVAPLWAGLIACINHSLGKPVGFVNPLLYPVAPSAEAFHDITKGTNGVYSAGAGWDPCTGLGSPGGVKLLQALKPANS